MSRFIISLVIYFLLSDNCNATNPVSSDEEETKTNYTGIIKCVNDANCNCPSTPITERYPNIVDPTCQSYYLCHKTVALPKLCDVRKIFHPEKRECLPRSSILYSLCPAAINCDVNGLAEDPRDCTKYYVCLYKQAYHYGCKSKHYFHAERKKCIKDKKKARTCNINRISIPRASQRHVNGNNSQPN